MFNFNFEKGVNLLKGSSGVGKSTVFMAISWCLYKKPSIGNTPIYPSSDKETVVVVNIPSDNIIIKRIAPKTYFSVTLSDGSVLENDEAQLYINKIYGKEHVWKTCNYVSQGTINHLISGEMTDSQRWEVLYTIAFEGNGNNKTISMDMLKTELRTRAEVLNKLVNLSNLKLDDLTRRITDIKSKTDVVKQDLDDLKFKNHPLMNIEDSELALLDFEINTLKPRPNKNDLDDLKNTRDDLVCKIESYRDRKSELTNIISNINLEKKNEEREIYNRYSLINNDIQKQESKLIDLERKLKRLTRIEDALKTLYSEQPTLKNHVEEWKSSKLTRLCKLFDTISWARDIDLKLLTYPNIENYIKLELENRSFNKRRTQLLDQLNTYSDLITKYDILGKNQESSDWLSLIKREFVEEDDNIKGVKQFVKCPCCSEDITLIIGKSNNVEKIIKSSNVNNFISKSLLVRIGERDRIKRLYDNIESDHKIPIDLSNKDISYLYRLNDAIKTWESLPTGLLNLVNKFIDYKPSQNALSVIKYEIDFVDFEPTDDIETQLVNLRSVLSTLKNEKTVYQNTLEELAIKYSNKLRSLEAEMTNVVTNLTTKRESLTDVVNKIKELERVESIWNKLDKLNVIDKRQFEEICNDRKKYTRLISEITGLMNRLSEEEDCLKGETEINSDNINKLKLISTVQSELEDVESYVLHGCVNKISSLSNSFLENAFDNPITVNLVTEKESRTGKSKKHSVGIVIKSGKPGSLHLVERSIDGFSGGETDRISLGFSTAITTYSSFPMLMLDECISSLDTEMKDKVIRALRQQAKTTNKSIVLVCHDAVDGLFDHVCQVE